MSALKQYIDLYEAHKSLIDKGCCGALNDLRPQAYEALKRTSLPKKGSEDFEHTSPEDMLAPDFGVNLNRANLPINPAESFSCRVPALSTAMFFLTGDKFAAAAGAQERLPQGVIACSLAYAAQHHPELVKRYYGSMAPLSNPLVALNTMLVQDGFFLYVPKNVKVDRALQLVNILAGEMPMMAVRRLLIVLEQGAEVKLLCCDHTQGNNSAMMNLQTIEIHAGPASHLDLYELEESSPLTSRLSSLYLYMERDANILLDGITLYNGSTRNEYFCNLTAPGAELRLLGMGIEDASRHLDNYTKICHLAPHCKSDELMKYVVEDEATGVFSGRIYVAHGAEKTEAYQANRNMVTSPQARMYSKPQLEIYNDDVKCSHGTAIGRMDQAQLFYMQQRGLSLPVAQTLLKQAFMADVIEGVRLEPLRDRLRMLVDMRFASSGPHDCEACASTSC